jgi:hypothetical protein
MLFLGDEIFSDSYKIKLVDDLYYEVEGKNTTQVTSVDESKLGANPSAEEGGEATEDSSVSGCDIVLGHRLQETSFSKKDYATYIKAYVKKLKEKVDQENPERGEFMKAKLPALVKKITGNIDKYRFFTGESMDAEGLVVLMDYRDDEVTPFLIVLKDGVFEEKCVCYTQFLQQCKKN